VLDKRRYELDRSRRSKYNRATLPGLQVLSNAIAHDASNQVPLMQ